MCDVVLLLANQGRASGLILNVILTSADDRRSVLPPLCAPVCCPRRGSPRRLSRGDLSCGLRGCLWVVGTCRFGSRWFLCVGRCPLWKAHPSPPFLSHPTRAESSPPSPRCARLRSSGRGGDGGRRERSRAKAGGEREHGEESSAGDPGVFRSGRNRR